MTFEQVVIIVQLIITMILAGVTVRQAQVTHQLEQRLYRLNTNLDQSIQRLHRAREANIQQHKAFVYILEYVNAHKAEGNNERKEIYFEKHAEYAAYTAELRGLTFAIADKELLGLVNDIAYNDDPVMGDVHAGIRSEKIHARISELLDLATAETPKTQPEDWRTTT